MPRLAIYSTKPTPELIDLYELITTDLANSHRELADLQSELHSTYIESYSHSQGKSVAERNRDADYHTKSQYAEILRIRGDINTQSTIHDMLANLISWRLHGNNGNPPHPHTDLTATYPLNHDQEVIGHGNK